MHRTRNAAWGQLHRGFESLPLRQFPLIILDYFHVLVVIPINVPQQSVHLGCSSVLWPVGVTSSDGRFIKATECVPSQSR
jgi:hypothetical protein